MLITYILLFTVALDVPAVRQYLKPVIDYVNSISAKMESLELICYTIIGTLIVMYLKEIFFNSNDVDDTGFFQQFLRLMRRLPMLEKTVAKKINAVNREVEDELRKGLEDKTYLHTLPLKGWSPEEILKAVEEYKSFGKYSWEDGYVSGTIYHGNDSEFLNMIRDVYGETSYTNPLHSDVFPGIRIMEGEIIRMICNLFNGDSQACGTVTTGGTESIFLACKAYRDYARNSKDIQYPNMVIPVTAHAAFDKAAHMLKIKVKHVPVDPESTKVNVAALRKAIDRNTCMLVASAPAFPHGGIDPVEAIADIGYYYKIPVHVDCCLGGFLLPFMGKAGFNLPPFDFSIPGVTSISADTHKYAYAPKGSSVVLYRDKEYRHYQFSVQPDWPGGIYGTPNISGSRAGGIIATCWASLLYHGEETYIECTKKIISTTKYIVKGLREIPDLFVFGEPEVSVIAVGSDVFDIYRLSGALSAQKNWSLNLLQFPSGFHICVTLQHTQDGVADRFLDDVRECTLEIMRDPHRPAEGSAAIYGMAQTISDRSVVSEIVWAFIDSCYNVENRDDDTEKH